MSWTFQVKISEPTYQTHKVTMWFFRLIGLFPFTITRSRSKIFLKLSPLYLVCGWVAIGFWIFMAHYGLLLDSRSKNKSIRIESDTDELLLLIQTSGFSAVCLAGAFINTWMFRNLFGYIRSIYQADLIMKTVHKKSYTYKLLLVVTYTVVSNCAIAWFYLLGCYRILGDSVGFWGVMERYLGLNVVAAVSYASEFTNFVVLGGLEKRIRRLNELLERLYLKMNVQRRWGTIDGSQSFARLTEAFLKIMDAAKQLDRLLGLFTLITIVAVFWALVQEPYFFILALTGKRGDVRSGVEVLETSFDLYFHITRVLLIIEPPYACLVQIEKTKGLVCRLSSCNLTYQARKQINTLSVMLELRKLKFSPLGLFRVDRMLFTSLLEIIVTLLVVLLQYRDALEIKW